MSDGVEAHGKVLADTHINPMPAPPTVVKTYPTDGNTNVPVAISVIITFDSAMDPFTTFNAISISQWFGAEPTWKNGDTELTLSPDMPLKSNTPYSITITTAAKSKDGISMQRPYEFAFQTRTVSDTKPPKIIWTTPANGDAVFEQPVKVDIRFSKNMWKSVVSSVSIDRGTLSAPTWSYTNNTMSFAASDLIPNAYTITVSSQRASDCSGNKLDGNGDGVPGDDYVLSFAFFGNSILPATLNVNAIDTAHSVPISDIEVTLILSGETIATVKAVNNYTVRFINLFPGDYDIIVRKEGYPEARAETAIASGQEKNITVHMAKEMDAILSMAFPIILIVCIVIAVIAALIVKREYYRLCPTCGKYNRTRFDTCKRCGYDYVRGSARPITLTYRKK
jgi:hypothetical protein